MKTRVIKLTPDEVKLLNSSVSECKDGDIAFNAASNKIRKARDILWEQLGKIYPDAMDKNTKFDHEKMELIYIDED